MKFKDLENDKIIEVKEKSRIEKLKGYPDKFEAIIEPKKEDKKEEKNKKK